MDLSVYDVDYETDELSITSTVESVGKETYNVEDILSEALVTADDGHEEMRYLIKWLTYDLHRCTWEPYENLEDTSLLRIWENRRIKLGENKFQRMIVNNRNNFEEAQDRAEAAKSTRDRKRAKKRRMLDSLQRRAVLVVSDSENDIPLAQRIKGKERQQRVATAATPEVQSERGSPTLFVTATPEVRSREGSPTLLMTEEKRLHRKPPIEQSPSEHSEISGPEDTTRMLLKEHEPSKSVQDPSNDQQQREPLSIQRSPSLLETLESKEKPRTADTLRNSSEQHAQLQGGLPMTNQATSPGPALEPIPVPPRSRSGDDVNAATSTLKRGRSLDREAPATKSTAFVGPKSTEASAATTARRASMILEPVANIKRTASGSKGLSSIKMVNVPKDPVRVWKNSDKPFTTLRSRWSAQKRGHKEGTPDPFLLDFVDKPPTGGFISRSTQPKPTAAPVNATPYGRRDSGPRRLQEVITDNEPSGDTPPLRPFESGKIPMMCFDWRNGHCPYTAEKCRFLHREKDPYGEPYEPTDWMGRVPPKYAEEPVTCFYWLRGDHGCSKSAKQCSYAHENTGLLASNDRKSTQQIDRNEVPSGHIKAPGPFRPSTMPKHCNPPVTCWYWLRTPKGCLKLADVCVFAHENTGLLGNAEGRPFEPIDRNERPASMIPPHPMMRTCFFWNQGICRRSDSECRFPHRYTGWVGDPPKVWRPAPGWKPPSRLRGQDESLQSSLKRPPQPALLSPAFDERVQPTFEDQSSFAQTGLQRPGDSHVETGPSRLSSLDLKREIDNACKLDFDEMFCANGDVGMDIILDKRAFLIFHPEYHAEEIELITRWLLVHHIETYSFWFDGAWESFQESIINGGSGVIMAHPDFEYYADIPGFGDVLKGNVRIWSVGFQEAYDYDPSLSTTAPTFRYDRIMTFPHGGVIYITDDVFETKPQEALKLIQLFVAKIEKCRQVTGPIDPSKRVDDGCLLWRLAVRPAFMQTLVDKVEQLATEANLSDPAFLSRIKLYELLSADGYIEQDQPNGDENIMRADDYFPIISERASIMQDLYYPALAQTQALANTKMVEYFGGLAIDLRQYYRQYFVVHTDPNSVVARDWKKRIQNIDEVMTPEKCIEYFEEPAKGNRFEFYEWAHPEKKRVDSAAG